MTISELEKMIDQVRKTGESCEIDSGLTLYRGGELQAEQKEWIDSDGAKNYEFDPSEVYAVGDDGAIDIADDEQLADSV